VVKKIDGPHGTVDLGRWSRPDGGKIFLTWSPASHQVWLDDGAEMREFVKIASWRTIWTVVRSDHLGGEQSDPADEVLARFKGAASVTYPLNAPSKRSACSTNHTAGGCSLGRPVAIRTSTFARAWRTVPGSASVQCQPKWWSTEVTDSSVGTTNAGAHAARADLQPRDLPSWRQACQEGDNVASTQWERKVQPYLLEQNAGEGTLADPQERPARNLMPGLGRQILVVGNELAGDKGRP
jgi:hypothetical protein